MKMSKTLDPNDWNTMEDWVNFNLANKLEASQQNVSMVVTNTIVTPKCTALSLIEYLEKKRFLTSSECSQIIRAWDRADWEILIGFIKKYTEREKE